MVGRVRSDQITRFECSTKIQFKHNLNLDILIKIKIKFILF